MTEARDALAAALADPDEPNSVDWKEEWYCTPRELAAIILAALPDGWVLARRQDAEDGAALREFGADAEFYIRRLPNGQRNVYVWALGGRTAEANGPTIAAAARKAREALP